MSRILVVDDELSMREMLEVFFVSEGHDVETASDGAEALAKLEADEFDLVLTDLRMPKTNGLTLLERCRDHFPETPVIVMTAFASPETAVHAWKLGAHDYFTKPFRLDDAKAVIDRALLKRRAVLEARALRAELVNSAGRAGGLIGNSGAMRGVFDLIRRVACTRTSVLILGESGTGKELVARAVHQLSDRADHPFLVVNCAAIPEQLLESELFGHRKGTFTGATSDREGLFKAASGGTLLLDEIGEMPLGMQVKLLRVLQERKVKAVGDPREESVDVRVLAATNRDLEAEVKAGRFREDLYYRLNVISVELPPLRDRPSDIPLLAHHFLRRYAAEFGKRVTEIDSQAMECLVAHPFSGNVRELANILERAVALEDGEVITVDSLPPALRHVQPRPAASREDEDELPLELPEGGVDLEGAIMDLERRLIQQALSRTGGRKKEAAQFLGVTFRSLRYRLAKLGIKAPD